MNPENKWLRALILIGILIAILYVCWWYSFLLFHLISELFSIIIAVSIGIVAWNSRRRLDNDFLLFIGIAFIFIAAIDLLHTLAYKGMNVFEGYDADLPTQLWIGARYLQAGALVLSPLFIVRRLDANVAMIGWGLLTGALLGLIFLGLFPSCFIEGQGLTDFKVYSELVIVAILVVASLHVGKHRKRLDREVYGLIQLAIWFMVASELAFTQYASVFADMNAIGHVLKVMEFYLLYLAILRTGISEPFRILFKDLKESEVLVRDTLDTVPVLVIKTDRAMNVILSNHLVVDLLDGADPTGKDLGSAFGTERGMMLTQEVNKLGEGERSIVEMVIVANRARRTIEWRCLRTADGFLLMGLDVTAERVSRDLVSRLNEDRRVIHKTLRHDVLNQIMVARGNIELYKMSDREGHLAKAIAAMDKTVEIIQLTRDLERALESGRPLEDMDVRQLAMAVLADMDTGAVEVRLNGDLMIVADEAMASVLGNLIGNAITHARPETVSINMWEDDIGKHIEVRDDGRGVPQDLRESLFEEGTKGGGSEGTGMGLYLVRNTIERYGGGVRYFPGEPRGSVFRIDLP